MKSKNEICPECGADTIWQQRIDKLENKVNQAITIHAYLVDSLKKAEAGYHKVLAKNHNLEKQLREARLA